MKRSKSERPNRSTVMTTIPLNWPIISLLVLMFAQAAAAEQTGDLPQFIVHLETGPQWQDALPPNEQAGFAEHSANMRALRESGQILYGARYDDYGLLIMAAESIEQVRDLLDQDPGVQAGLFVYRASSLSVFYRWQTP